MEMPVLISPDISNGTRKLSHNLFICIIYFYGHNQHNKDESQIKQ